MISKILNLYKIKILSEVCKTNSYRIASQNLFITPSAISKAIKSLEAEWKIELVHSNGNSVKVTAAAEQLAVIASRLLLINDEFNSLVSMLNRESVKSILQIGSGGSHSKIIMNQLLELILRSSPDFGYEVTTSNSVQILNLVERGELDCGVVSGTIPEHVESVLLYVDNISLYAHYTHPLAATTVSLTDLKYPVCLREKGSSTRSYVERFLSEQHIGLSNTRQTGKNEELTDHLCQTQHALQFMSDYYFKNSHWNKEYVKIVCNELVIPVAIYFITRKNFTSEAITNLIGSRKFQDEFLTS